MGQAPLIIVKINSSNKSKKYFNSTSVTWGKGCWWGHTDARLGVAGGAKPSLFAYVTSSTRGELAVYLPMPCIGSRESISVCAIPSMAHLGVPCSDRCNFDANEVWRWDWPGKVKHGVLRSDGSNFDANTLLCPIPPVQNIKRKKTTPMHS